MNKIFWSLITITYTTFLKGFAISILWSWFVVPIFILPTLTIAQAAGLGILASIMTSKKPDFNKETDFYKDVGEILFYYTAITVIGLSIGWLLT